ncbi:MAG: flagellar biosynthesis protein FlhF [Treponema sp.]|jgi:flagellar biosynthesis protein FlhF|nr:flagellar biosynthesis protein FlhF [Treponema sp.]
MEIFTEEGRTIDECQAKIREKYGDRALILGRKHTRRGGIFGFGGREVVEMQGYIPTNAQPASNAPPLTAAAAASETASTSDALALTAAILKEGGIARGAQNTQAALRAPLRGAALELQKQNIILAALARNAAPRPQAQPAPPPPPPAAGAAEAEASMQRLFAEMRSLRESVEAQKAPREAHPSLGRLDELLEENDFSSSYKKNLLERLRAECTMEDLDNLEKMQKKLLFMLGEDITFYQRDERYARRPRVIILVGPTGVGKTTTIAKLATALAIDRNNGRPLQKIALVTTDSYRISARQQLETYGDILKCPTYLASEAVELQRVLVEKARHTDLILVDTTGRSPHDGGELQTMQKLLSACGSRAETFLVASVTTKTRDLSEIVTRFEPFNPRALIVTKLDETMHAGNILSVMWEKQKPIVYLCHGQTPVDIQTANALSLLERLDGFTVSRSKLEERFGAAA